MGKRLSHPSPKDTRDGLKNIRDYFQNIHDSPEDIRDNPEKIHDSPKDIHDCSPENPRQSEEEWIEAQPPSRPLPAL